MVGKSGPMKRLGVSSTAYHGELAPQLDLIAELDLNYIELWDQKHPVTAQLIDTLSSYNFQYTAHGPFVELNIASTDEGFRQHSIKRTIECLEKVAILNPEAIVIHPGMAIWHDVPVNTVISLSLLSLEEIAKRADDLGLRITVENLPLIAGVEDAGWKGPVHLGINPDQIEEMLDQLPNVGLTIDVGHAATTSNMTKEIDDLLNISYSRLLNTHWHDYNGEEDHLALGQGNIDFKMVFDRIDKAGYRGPYILEVRSHQDVLTSIETISRLT